MFRNPWHRWWKRRVQLSEQRSRKHICPRHSSRLNLEVLEDRTLLSTFTVDRLTDSGEGSDLAGDLRYCITQAADGDSIQFGVQGVINLTHALPGLAHSISIDGPGADLLTVRRDTGGYYRIFRMNSGTAVSIAGLTIANGSVLRDIGGGIHNEGTLIVSNCTITGNGAGGPRITDTYPGGGIYNGGTLTVSNSTISGNDALGSGGGIANGGTLTVINSTVSGNSGYFGGGGGIENDGTLTVSNSTISGNFAAGGGGIDNGGTLTVSNSTITANRGNIVGGGIALLAGSDDSTALLVNCTIANNTAPGNPIDVGKGSQLYSRNFGTGKATAELRNTIVSGDGAKRNFFADKAGTFISQGHNLSSDDGSGFLTGPGDLINTDPLLGPLQDNGGPTKTMALLPGSPAVDAGDNTDAPEFDQRGPGFPRIVGGTIDIGAFEAQIGVATQLVVSAPTSVTAGSPFDVTVTALDAYHHRASGYTGTVTFSTTDPDLGVVLPADYTFTADDSGVHTFSDTGLGETTLVTPGDQTITVTDTADNTITGSASVTVAPGPAAPPAGAASRPLIRTTTADNTPARRVQPGQDVDAVDRVFASVGVEEPAFVLAGLRHKRPADDRVAGNGELLV